MEGRQEGSRIPDEQVYSTLLATARQTPSPLVAELVRVEETRGRHLLLLRTSMLWVLEAYEDIVRHLEEIRELDALDEHVANLVGRCREDVVFSMDALLVGDDARIADLGRDMMEIEFLIRDFTGAVGNLREWADAAEGKRNDRFAFGRLASREERRLHFPDGQLLPDRREYQAHSASTHPTPDGRPNLWTGDANGFIVHAASEILLHHAGRVISAMYLYREKTAGAPFAAMTESHGLDLLSEAAKRQRDVMDAIAPDWLKIPREPFHKSTPASPQPPGPPR